MDVAQSPRRQSAASHSKEPISVQAVDSAAVEKPWTSDMTLNKLLNFGKRKSLYLYNTINNTAVPTLMGGWATARDNSSEALHSVIGMFRELGVFLNYFLLIIKPMSLHVTAREERKMCGHQNNATV